MYHITTSSVDHFTVAPHVIIVPLQGRTFKTTTLPNHNMMLGSSGGIS